MHVQVACWHLLHPWCIDLVYLDTLQPLTRRWGWDWSAESSDSQLNRKERGATKRSGRSSHFALTPLGRPLKISPESSDGFASVGTILPREGLPCCRAALFIYRANAQRGILLTEPGASCALDTPARTGILREFRAPADVAQLVEQLIRNQQVTGSSPVVGSSNRQAHVPASNPACGIPRNPARLST